MSYVAALTHNWFGWNLDPTKHWTILFVTLILLAIQTTLNITGASVMARVARLGVYVEIVGTFGIVLILWIHGFHHGLGFLFTDQGAQHASSNALGLNFHGNWLTGAALIAVLAPVYIFYGFESAGDIAEETKDASRQIPRAMRAALIWGGVASLVLTAALLLAMPAHNPVAATVKGGGVPFILGQLSEGMQDFLLLPDHLRVLLLRHLDPGRRQPARVLVRARRGAARVELGRQGARPLRTPVNALVAGAFITVLFVLLVFLSPGHNVKILFITYPANTNVLVSLVSFGVSGIYLSFLLAVIASIVAHSRGWVAEGAFRLGRWTWPVLIIAVAYLGLMFINIVAPTGLDQPARVLQHRLDHAPR